MTNKTISINPSLFSTGGSKTKKVREKKQRPVVVPLISPNVLKNKLLKRIKEHKNRETEGLENNKKKINENDSKIHTTQSTNISEFSDEFNDSISYLQTLSKQKKVNAEKEKYEIAKQKRREEIQRNTVKNYQALYTDNLGNTNISPQINIDLPEELQQPLISINTEQIKKPSELPYGILKGGSKPTYRDWSRTQRNMTVTNPNASLIIQDNNLNKQNLERENRLNSLREKLKLKQINQEIENVSDNKPVNINMENALITQSLIQKPNEENINSNNIIIQNVIPNIEQTKLQIPIPIQENILNNNLEYNIKPSESKRIIKKTIKKRYTLGRSKIKKTIGILIKDRGTRKKVLIAQKELKRKPLNDVKSYLREHNLIKIGSNAPNDVLRKIYENAMLAGEITNNNKDMLLYNISKGDSEL